MSNNPDPTPAPAPPQPEAKKKKPKSNGVYLNIILGDLDLTIPTQDAKFRYKEQYENFKLTVNIIILLFSALNLLLALSQVRHRVLGAILHFLLVWYHCTLTIRESILIVNGSRIKGWWRALQFISTVQAGVMIVWPDGHTYDMFEKQFLLYTCYTCGIQYMQYLYQRGCLYRLRALGERYDMDITIQGFHSWMWKGLSFLLPLLYFTYFCQFYNAYTLYKFSQKPETTEWQVPALAYIYGGIALGNTMTTSITVISKLRSNLTEAIKSRVQQINTRRAGVQNDEGTKQD